MEDILNVLSEKIDKAVTEINRLKNDLNEKIEVNAKQEEQILELQVELESKEENLGKKDIELTEKLSGFSEKISEVVKKLDSVI